MSLTVSIVIKCPPPIPLSPSLDFLITDPCIAGTVAEDRVFDLVLRTFLHDVMLVNITFDNDVMTVSEANARGFNVQEHRFPNGSKAFSLQVPFSDPVVLKSVSLAKCSWCLCSCTGMVAVVKSCICVAESSTGVHNLHPSFDLWSDCPT